MPSLLLSFSLLCLSLHACHGGRQIGGTQPKFDKVKDVEKKVEVHEAALGTARDEAVVGGGSSSERRESASTGEKTKDQVKAILKKFHEIHEAIQGDVHQSFGKVSWKTSQEHGAGNPDFNLDYFQPKTHPPSNN